MAKNCKYQGITGLGTEKCSLFWKGSGCQELEIDQILNLLVFIKYIAPLSINNWIRQRNKSFANSSTMWKALIQWFPLLRNCLVWKSEDDRSVKIGPDTWTGSSSMNSLSENVVPSLRQQVIYTLHDGATLGRSTFRYNGWRNADELGLVFTIEKEGWNTSINRLQMKRIH